ncbi:MAG: Magnesium and cobalt efflux protein CorC [Steroidobacteraceae bacterium]|nr:Magnesium and cobalt efflux protein CorC [Steroidobacteraceae bacterium]
MPKDAHESGEGNATGRWLKRLKRSVAGAPEDRETLLENLHEASTRGLLDADALGMIEGVLDVADLRVRDIMVPRAQMVFVRRNDPASEILPTIVESGHSRFPVMDDDRDDIVGILLAKDLLRVYAEGGTERFDIRECMRPAVFVPEAKRVNVLLKEFRGNRNHMAIVVDEYGGVAGLVTIEDVVEQIVGEIDDEFDVDEDLNIRKDAERQFTVRGITLIEEFNEYFDTSYPDDEFDTVAGLVMKEFGRLPRRGETAVIGGIEFRVMRADRRRVESLRVTTPRDVVPPDERAARDEG